MSIFNEYWPLWSQSRSQTKTGERNQQILEQNSEAETVVLSVIPVAGAVVQAEHDFFETGKVEDAEWLATRAIVEAVTLPLGLFGGVAGAVAEVGINIGAQIGHDIGQMGETEIFAPEATEEPSSSEFHQIPVHPVKRKHGNVDLQTLPVLPDMKKDVQANPDALPPAPTISRELVFDVETVYPIHLAAGLLVVSAIAAYYSEN